LGRAPPHDRREARARLSVSPSPHSPFEEWKREVWECGTPLFDVWLEK
jgi:hypothetical protein